MEISRKKILNKEYRTYVKKNPNQEQNFRQIFEEMKSRNKKIDLKIYESLKNSLRDTEEEIGKIKQSNKKFKEKIEELSTKYHGTLMPSPPKENKGEILFEEEKISQKKCGFCLKEFFNHERIKSNNCNHFIHRECQNSKNQFCQFC